MGGWDFPRTIRTKGEIAFHSNGVFWKIPKFSQVQDTALYSPEFAFSGITWQLFLRPYDWNSRRGQNQIEIKVLQNFMVMYLNQLKGLKKCFNVRLSINGKNTEFSSFGKLNSLEKELSFLFLERSELDRKRDLWVPDGNLSLFLSMEDVDEVSAEKTFSDSTTGMGFKKLQEDLKDLMQNGNISDVVLKVDNKEFKSHRCILAARSPVFMAMMTHETKESATGVVEIKDVEPNIFSDFLRYLYTGCLEVVTPENAHGLFRAADIYQVHELKKHCMKNMMKNITVDNFCDLYILSLLYEDKNLIDACSLFFVNNSLEIVKTAKWQIFLTENPIVGNELFMKLLEMNK